jgi:EAL domain-containing protein (putative c-di-GMP-specific phosphodiesterase class I)
LAFTKPFLVSEHELSLTTSIGICFYPINGNTIDILLRNADSAMYQAKDLGANQFQFYTENLNKLNLLQLEKETELRRGLLNKEFFLCYQPQYNLSTGALVSMEALIRWNNPQRGLLQPIDFIPFAEQTGLIVSIDEWVLRTVCNQIKNWQDQGLPLIRIAVNVTTKQFKAYNFPRMVKSIIESSEIPPQFLEFELSENIMINNPDIIKSIAQLKDIGVQIALDDFGTGYSALSYLRLIPLDRLKIDQSFIQRIGLNAHDDVIIKAIIAIAKGLNLEILAEGVETQNQLDFLKNVQCGEVQGFLFNEPLKLDECTQLLKKLNSNKSSL